MKQTVTNLSKEFSTGYGLRLWLFFLLSFYFLGYPVFLSILLGAIGGLAGGYVAGWWKSKDDPSDIQPEEIVDEDELRESRTKVSGLRLAKQQRDSRYRQQSQGAAIPFSGLFGKRDNKLSKRSARRVNQ